MPTQYLKNSKVIMRGDNNNVDFNSYYELIILTIEGTDQQMERILIIFRPIDLSKSNNQFRGKF